MNNKEIFDNYLTSHYTDTEKVNFKNKDAIVAHLQKNVGPLNHNFKPFFEATIDKKAKVLDLGCGFGSFLYFLESNGYTNVTGVDISSEEIALCKKLFKPYTFVQADIHDYLRTTKEKFDVIYLSHVLEHIKKEDLFNFLKGIKKILSDDGSFIIVVPNSATYFNAAANRYGDITHELGFSILSLKQLLMLAGFKSITVKNFYGVGNFSLNILRKIARFGFELFIQLLGYDKQEIYTPSLIAIVKK